MSFQYYLRDFKEDLKDELGKPDTKKKIIDTASSLPKVPDAASQISSFGIGIGLAYLGHFLATKKKGSTAARFLARILGANVDAINRDDVLQRLGTEEYRKTIREHVLNVIKTASIDDFAATLGLGTSEAWEVYRQIKDIILDAEIVGMISQAYNEIGYVESALTSEVKNLRKAIDEQSNKQLLEIKQHLAKIEMSKLGLEVWTIARIITMGKGNNDSWKEGRFTIREIKGGYDLRRNQTDEIINSVENNIGTILFGESYSGKSTVLSRVMFEEITERDYIVVFGSGVKTEAPLLKELIEIVSEHNPESRILLIADNVQRSGTEELFKIFNEYNENGSDHIRFLFAARGAEFDIAAQGLERSYRNEISHALTRMRQIHLSFNEQDAVNFLKQAITMSDSEGITTAYLEREARERYVFSKGDLFMFIYSVRHFIGGSRVYKDFVKEEMEQKIESISQHPDLTRAAILCSFLGMFGTRILATLLDTCEIYFDMRNLLIKEGFLFYDGVIVDEHHYEGEKEPDVSRVTQYRVRHERWSQEFLFYIYQNLFSNVFKSFDNKYRISEMLYLILNNLEGIYDLISIPNICTSLHREERFQPIVELVIDNFEVPDHLNDNDKANLYCFGLGNFYSITGTYGKTLTYEKRRKYYEQAIKCYEKATDLDPKNADAWYNKGYVLEKIGVSRETLGGEERRKYYEQAIKCYEKATDLDPKNADAWYNKGYVLDLLGNYKQAIEYYYKAAEVNSNKIGELYNKISDLETRGEYELAILYYNKIIKIDPDMYGKGLVLDKLGRHEEAIETYYKAVEINLDAERYREAFPHVQKLLEIDPDNASLLYTKGFILYNLESYEEAIICYENALKIDPDNAYVWFNKGVALDRLGKHEEAMQSYGKVTELDPNYVDAWYNRAYYKVYKGDIENGLTDLRRAIEIGGEEYVKSAKQDFEIIQNNDEFKRILQINNTDRS